MKAYTKEFKHFRSVYTCLAIMLTALLLVGCGSTPQDIAPQVEVEEATATQQVPSDTEPASDDSTSSTEPVSSGKAPRTDTPLFNGAEFVLEKTYAIAVEELYATDASVEDVVAFYADFPQFAELPDTMGLMYGGAYLETPVMKLLMRGEEVGDEVAESGPLMYIMVVPSDSESLPGIIGQSDAQKLPPGKTIISLRILTDY